MVNQTGHAASRELVITRCHICLRLALGNGRKVAVATRVERSGGRKIGHERVVRSDNDGRFDRGARRSHQARLEIRFLVPGDGVDRLEHRQLDDGPRARLAEGVGPARAPAPAHFCRHPCHGRVCPRYERRRQVNRTSARAGALATPRAPADREGTC